ncbi:acetate--CoA ligase family protein [Amycolatopsis thermoflava]|uniref:acetate--CoA ligase family protein n=1 Tax=Amycolatopsis thermoflava TaxID=84480 RepID=UPI0004085DB1|nr:acetate--CoA ligase family protein [Amycolatopsis thermoflava]
MPIDRRIAGEGFPLTPGDARIAVPEHVVKQLLTEHGVAVPRGRVLTGPADARGLDGPLVLKAWGPGLLHKSDVGAVRLGISTAGLPGALDDMAVHLARQGIEPRGYLAEEQHPGGTELIIGVVRDQTFGPVVLLGLGGIATELLDLTALRPCPLTRADAEDLVATFPGAPLLTGARGKPPVDRAALVDLLVAIAGAGGLVERIGPDLAEFECNPVVVTPEGATALDARLILDPGAAPVEQAHDTDFTALFAPRRIAVAGASTGKSGFGNRFLAAYRQAGWTDGLYALHPAAAEVDGVPAVATIADVPGGADYLLVALPAARAVEVVAQAAGKVPFVQVISGGFGEMNAAGAALETDLAAAVAGTKTRLLGPNCLGVFSPAGRQTFTPNAPTRPGRVSVVSQSGGLSGDIVTVGDRRGLRFAKVASIGNAIDVTHGDLLSWLVDDPETDVLGVYLEGTRDGAGLLRALRRADGRKPVVLLRGGSSAQGARAVSSHTGSLAGEEKVWRAVADATGVSLVSTLEDLLGSLAYLQGHPEPPAPGSSGVLVIGLGGGASVLATDACDRAGLELTPLRPGLRARLRELGHGAGTSVANPLEVPVGPVSPAGLLGDALEPVFGEDGQPYRDVLVHVNVAAYYNYGKAGLRPLIDAMRDLLERGYPARTAVVTRNSEVAAPEDAALLARFAAERGVPLFRSFDEAATAIAAAQRFDARRVS